MTKKSPPKGLSLGISRSPLVGCWRKLFSAIWPLAEFLAPGLCHVESCQPELDKNRLKKVLIKMNGG